MRMLAKLGHKEAKKAVKEFKNRQTFLENSNYIYDLDRSDSLLIKVVEKLGCEESSGSLSELKIVEIPDGTKWEIEEYDGREWISEVHRTW